MNLFKIKCSIVEMRFNEDHTGIEKESCAAEPVKYVELESSDEGTEPVNDQVSDLSTIGDMDQSPLSLRRSEHVRRRPDYYIEGTSAASQDLDEPCTLKKHCQVQAGPSGRKLWKQKCIITTSGILSSYLRNKTVLVVSGYTK